MSYEYEARGKGGRGLEKKREKGEGEKGERGRKKKGEGEKEKEGGRIPVLAHPSQVVLL